MASWCLFFLFRKTDIDPTPFEDVNQLFSDSNFWWGLFLVPLGWLMLYTIQGSYRNVLRKSRLKELGETAIASLIGVLFTVLKRGSPVKARKMVLPMQ